MLASVLQDASSFLGRLSPKAAASAQGTAALIYCMARLDADAVGGQFSPTWMGRHTLYTQVTGDARGPDNVVAHGANRRLWTAVDTGYLLGIRAAIRAGADIDSVDLGWAAVNWAVSQNRLDVASELLSLGANPNAGHPRASGLHVAAYRGRFDVVLMLLRSGAELREIAGVQHPMNVIPEWFGASPIVPRSRVENCPITIQYLRRVYESGGFNTYKETRYRGCLAVHLIARHRRLPTDVQGVILKTLLGSRGRKIIIEVVDMFSPLSTIIHFIVDAKMCLRILFKRYRSHMNDVLSEVVARVYQGRRVKLSFRLPDTDVGIKGTETLRSLGLSSAAEAGEMAPIVFEAHLVERQLPPHLLEA